MCDIFVTRTLIMKFIYGCIDFMKTDLLKGLTEEQIAKVKACRGSKDLLQLAQDEGVELTDEQLAAVNGGGCDSDPTSSRKCPSCGTKVDGKFIKRKSYKGRLFRYTCPNCGNVWEDYD